MYELTSDSPSVANTTLVEIGNHQASLNASKIAYTFLNSDGNEEQTITFLELNIKAKAIAAYLQKLELSGERALIIYPTSLEYITSFFGCIYAGVIAIPVYPPNRKSEKLMTLSAIAKDADAKIVMCSKEQYDELNEFFIEKSNVQLKLVDISEIDNQFEQNWQNPNLEQDTIAFLQYTSGSTGSPKGVMVSHKNLLYNAEMLKVAVKHTSNSIIVSWLPLYHDMGLIGQVLQSYYLGAHTILFSPTTFSQQPIIWLKSITKYKATTSVAPNFAFDLCVKRISGNELNELDLSSWDIAINGSEPIRAETLDNFANIFSKCGFKKSAFYPSYGLAEATLIVTGGIRYDIASIKIVDAQSLERNLVIENSSHDNKKTKVLVCCGHALLDSKIVIVNPQTRKLCDFNQIGEIWIQNASVTKGYWHKKQENEKIFRANIENSQNTYLRTGDLGFIDIDNQLYITGRLKDLIIINGRNIYPQDIERAVLESHEGLVQHGGAAFSIEIDGVEQLIITQEIKRNIKNYEEIVQAIWQKIYNEFNLNPLKILLLRQNTIPKTTSGKIQRNKCRQKYFSNDLVVYFEWKYSLLNKLDDTSEKNNLDCPLNNTLLNIINSSLSLPFNTSLNSKISLLELGFDSLSYEYLKYQMQLFFQFDMEKFINDFKNITIEQLTNIISTKSSYIVNDINEKSYIKKQGESDLPSSILPASNNQERIWFICQMMNSSVYNICVGLKVDGNLNTQILSSALNKLIIKHESLRSKFMIQNGQLYQHILKPNEINLTLNQYENLILCDSDMYNVINKEIEKPIKPTESTLFRISHYKYDETLSFLIINMHHIIADGWSIKILIEDLINIYNEIINNHIPSSNSSDIDLIERDNDYPYIQKSLIYWNNKLKDGQYKVNLPYDSRDVIDKFMYHGSFLSINIENELYNALKILTIESNTTLFVTCLCVVNILLYIYSGQEDLVIGVPILGRDLRKKAKKIDLLANVLPIRLPACLNFTFIQFIEHAIQEVSEIFEHSYVPLEKLISNLNIKRDKSINPLFNVLYSYQSFSIADISFNDAAIKQTVIHSGYGGFDLEYEFINNNTSLCLNIKYNSLLFKNETINIMAERVVKLLTILCNNPNIQISQISILTEYDLTIYHQLNNTQQEIKPYKLLHEQFDDVANRFPNATAVIYNNNEISYKYIKNISEQICLNLLNIRIYPGEYVGIFINRSPHVLISFLGISKSGATYIPLDPKFPRERIEYIICDLKLSKILTTSDLLHLVPKSVNSIICADQFEYLEHLPNYEITKIDYDNIMYILYTSGSTGFPKGVMVRHINVINFFNCMRRILNFTRNDKFLSVTTISFDIAQLEIYLPILTGGTLILASDNEVIDPQQLINLINKTNPKLMQATPSLWRMLIDANWKGQMGMTILCGGEELKEGLVIQLLNKCNKLFNLYGPTETTIWSTINLVNKSNFNIGKPIGNTRLYILDKYSNLVPVGITGELCIGGMGITAGYLNRPELTSERFVTINLNNSESEIIYKTGDLVKLLPGGTIEYYGRLDNQVKIRGHRVELCEIETLLDKYTEIKQSVVVSYNSSNGNAELACFITLQSDSTFTTKDVFKILSEKLPNYMIPTIIKIIDTFPLMPNGKINRKLLTESFLDSNFSESRPTVSNDKITNIITHIWTLVLGTNTKFGIDDSFFEIGGNSILLARTCSILNETLNLSIPLVDLYRHSTVRSLVAHLESNGIYRNEQYINQPSFKNKSTRECEIAIIGMAGRFPDANTINEFWTNLCTSKESITNFTNEELIAAGISESLLKNEHYIKAKGMLNNIEYFDADFFGISAIDAKIMDPQQRILLEVAWETLETAGYVTENDIGKIGVFVGLSNISSYLYSCIKRNSSPKNSIDEYQLFINNSNDFASVRTSYKLNLTGPSCTIQSGCSTSLANVCVAIQSLLLNQCYMALTGGICITLPSKSGYIYHNNMIFSPDGHCRAFDASAKGTVLGNGIGLVMLKRLEDAINDHDHIYATIRGYGFNNDGSAKIGYTAPSEDGQYKAIYDAHRMAEFNPESISYIEAHGTGTQLGDPIEFSALKRIFNQSNLKNKYCAIGSVKTNIGHLDTAAGIAGLIKTALSLYYKKIPASINYKNPNPLLEIDNSPFYINSQIVDWTNCTLPRRAGVSSFGVGGTNVHISLEESDRDQDSNPSHNQIYLCVLSARTEIALRNTINNILSFLDENIINISNMAFTLQIGRKAFNYRYAFFYQTQQDVIQHLKKETTFKLQCIDLQRKPIIWIIANDINQYDINSLYQQYHLFKTIVDNLNSIIQGKTNSTAKTPLFTNADIISNDSIFHQFSYIYCIGSFLIEIGIVPQLILAEKKYGLVASVLVGEITIEKALDSLINNTFIDYSDQIQHLYSSFNSLYIFNSRTTSDKNVAVDINNYYIIQFDEQLSPQTNKMCTSFYDYGSFSRNNLNLDVCLLLIIADAWIHGYEINWIKFNFKNTCKRIPLPTYPFERKKFWFDSPQSTNKPHPILGEQVNSPLDYHQYSVILSSETFYYPIIHEAYKDPLLPNEYYISFAIAIGKQFFDSSSLEIANTKFYEYILLLPNVSYEFQSIVKKSSEQIVELSIFNSTKPITDNKWKCSAITNIKILERNPLIQINLDTLRSGSTKFIEPSSFYYMLQIMGVDLANIYKCITELHIGDDEAFAKLDLNYNKSEEINYAIITNICTQLLSAIQYYNYEAKELKCLPQFIGNIKLFSNLTNIAFIHIDLSKTTIDTIVGNAQILDDMGNLLISINDYQLSTFINPKLLGKDISDTIQNSEITIAKSVSDYISSLYKEYFDVHDLTTTNNFFELGGDSLLAITMLERISKNFNIILLPEDILMESTINGLTKIIQQKLNYLANPINYTKQNQYNLVKLKDGSIEVDPIILIHPAGGTIFLYYDLVSHLKHTNHPIYGIQIQHSNVSDFIQSSVSCMANNYIELLNNKFRDLQYILIGLSFGGTVAYEMSQQLAKTNRPPSLLVLIDTPILKNHLDLKFDWEILAYFIKQYSNSSLNIDHFKKLTLDEQIDHVVNSLVKISRAGTYINMINMKVLLEIFKENIKAMHDYIPLIPNFTCNILYFKAKLRDNINPSNPEIDWINLLGDKLEVYEIDGNHNTIIMDPHVGQLASIVLQKLEGLRRILYENEF